MRPLQVAEIRGRLHCAANDVLLVLRVLEADTPTSVDMRTILRELHEVITPMAAVASRLAKTATDPRMRIHLAGVYAHVTSMNDDLLATRVRASPVHRRIPEPGDECEECGHSDPHDEIAGCSHGFDPEEGWGCGCLGESVDGGVAS